MPKMKRTWLLGNVAVPEAIALLVAIASPASAQDTTAVTPSYNGNSWVATAEKIELVLAGAGARGRVAVFIGETDYSALFDRLGNRLVYRANRLPLPSGEFETVVYHVSDDRRWQEIGRFPLKVLSPGGFQSVAVNPRLALNNKGQVAEGHRPIENAPQRAEYQDYALNTGLQTRHVRSSLTVTSQANFAAVTNRQEALRYGELQADAPKFDLSDYLITIERGGFSISAGHVGFGENRHLLNSFASRGVRAEARLGTFATLAASALNGNSIVGWANPFGLNSSDHRILAGTLNLTPIKSLAQQFAMQATFVDGSILPRAGFTQGAVLDAEKSAGGGVRVTVADASQRIRIDAGYSRSSFTNPLDTELSANAAIVPVKRVARYARYVDANAQLLRGTRLLLPTTLAISLQHERVDPLYRNVANPVSADVLQNKVTAQGSIGPLNLQAMYGRMHDNLANIASILSTHTRNASGNAALPLPMLFARATWLPTLTYGLTRLHQFGVGVPPNSDFTASHVPDQVSVNQTIGVEWQRTGWRLSYQRNHSDQDNRQIGRELADFLNTTNNIAFSINLLRVLDLSADVGFDDAKNEERSEENRTRRIGASLNWRPTSTTTFAGSLARTSQRNEPLTGEQTATDLRAELSQRLPLLRLSAASSPGQLFVRFARQSSDAFGPFTERSARRNWNVNTGVAIGVF